MLLEDKMPEAEVTIRLAMFLIEYFHTDKDVICAIDGSQVKVGTTVISPIVELLNSKGWRKRLDLKT